MLRKGTLLFTTVFCLSSPVLAKDQPSPEVNPLCAIKDTPQGKSINIADYPPNGCLLPNDVLVIPSGEGAQPVVPVVRRVQTQGSETAETKQSHETGAR